MEVSRHANLEPLRDTLAHQIGWGRTDPRRDRMIGSRNEIVLVQTPNPVLRLSTRGMMTFTRPPSTKLIGSTLIPFLIRYPTAMSRPIGRTGVQRLPQDRMKLMSENRFRVLLDPLGRQALQLRP